jgi:SAM-dependent methyltransferase
MTQSEFDTYADKYRDIHDNNVRITGGNSDYFTEYKIRELYRNIPISGREVIIDFGCGDGNSEVFLNQYFPESAIIGIDPSWRSIKKATRRIDCKRVLFTQFNGLNIPVKKEKADIVFASGVFHHINPGNYERILSELYSVIKTGGSLIIFEHNPLNPLTRKIVDACPFDEDAILIKAKRLGMFVKSAGFRHVRHTYTLFFPRHAIMKPFHILERFMGWIPVGAQYYIHAIK